jgi:hypothetical protein
MLQFRREGTDWQPQPEQEGSPKWYHKDQDTEVQELERLV